MLHSVGLEPDRRDQPAVISLVCMGGTTIGIEPVRIGVGTMAGPFCCADARLRVVELEVSCVLHRIDLLFAVVQLARNGSPTAWSTHDYRYWAAALLYPL